MADQALVVICVHPGRDIQIIFDTAAQFRLAYFDFSGTGYTSVEYPFQTGWSIRTHGKGEVLAALADQHLTDFDYLAIIDDDVGLRISDINRLLLLGRSHRLDLFQPSLSADSYISHPHLRHRPNHEMVETSFVEAMMPFFSYLTFERCRDLFAQSQSGWGIDIVWSDRICRARGRLGVIHAVVATHLRPVRSHTWIMPNGLTPPEEMRALIRRHGIGKYAVR
ncbi:MAG: hypothetical protein JSR19_06620 [Proteobacteria bacterium]|nr:hypothetical protein [Pseudomonadota bacterium]HQR04825.1 hypothetical protein [Rhodocyclaceae bacterium]